MKLNSVSRSRSALPLAGIVAGCSLLLTALHKAATVKGNCMVASVTDVFPGNSECLLARLATLSPKARVSRRCSSRLAEAWGGIPRWGYQAGRQEGAQA